MNLAAATVCSSQVYFYIKHFLKNILKIDEFRCNITRHVLGFNSLIAVIPLPRLEMKSANIFYFASIFCSCSICMCRCIWYIYWMPWLIPVLKRATFLAKHLQCENSRYNDKKI